MSGAFSSAFSSAYDIGVDNNGGTTECGAFSGAFSSAYDVCEIEVPVEPEVEQPLLVVQPRGGGGGGGSAYRLIRIKFEFDGGIYQKAKIQRSDIVVSIDKIKFLAADKVDNESVSISLSNFKQVHDFKKVLVRNGSITHQKK